MAFLKIIFGFFLLSFISAVAASTERHFPSGVRDIYIPHVEGIRSQLLQNIAPLVEQSIDQGLYPGAVILAAHHGQIIYRGVFGNRRIEPDTAPMTFNTIFDLASLTKAIVTTTAIMQLVEQGKIDLDAPVASYWPAFSSNGKASVTVRQLLTHTSGFPIEIVLPNLEQVVSEPIPNELSHTTKTQIINAVERAPLVHPSDTVYTYSDINFIALGYLVEIISGEQLDRYARNHIFQPVGMNHTFFLPPAHLKNIIAPTQIIHGKLRWGSVHDNIVYAMGGVSGMAGLFSDANDLGLFAQCLLNGGRIPSWDYHKPAKHLLGPLTIIKMTSPQTPKFMTDIHGLGWDIDTRYSNRGILFPIRSYGHTGWTGTSIWIDPTTETWLIILTSRSHPTLAPVNQLIHDRKIIANIVAASITDVPLVKINNTGEGELARAYKQ